MKTQSKPWITKGILTSIRKKAKIHRKLLEAKDQTMKKALNQEYIQNLQKCSYKHN